MVVVIVVVVQPENLKIPRVNHTRRLHEAPGNAADVQNVHHVPLVFAIDLPISRNPSKP